MAPSNSIKKNKATIPVQRLVSNFAFKSSFIFENKIANNKNKNLEIIIATLNLKITFVKTNPLVVKNETKTNAIMLQIISINIIDTLITISSIVVLNPKTLSKTIIVHTTRMTGKKLDEKK